MMRTARGSVGPSAALPAFVVWLCITACAADEPAGGAFDSATIGESDATVDAASGEEGAASSDIATGADVSDTTEDTATSGAFSVSSCPQETRVGRFWVEHLQFQAGKEGRYAAISGEVKNGVIPNTVLDLEAEVGACQFLRRLNPFCDPICGPTETCSLEGVCVPYPVNQDVGTVEITGLNEPVSLALSGGKNYFDTDVAHPAFEGGAAITLTASGGEVGGFSLSARGVEELEIPNISWVMSPGAPLDISWIPANPGARVRFSFNIDQHGLTPVTLVCDLEDSAATLRVDSTLVDSLIDYGVSGFASGSAVRYTADSHELPTGGAAGAGCVDFWVASHVAGLLEVDGHTPCFTSAECPPGQTCDVPVNTCVDGP
jgi:hypothetical protein